jgi:hypothetical protein
MARFHDAERPDVVSRAGDTVLASPHAGLVRLDFLEDGRVRLEVVEVRSGDSRRPLSMWLR